MNIIFNYINKKSDTNDRPYPYGGSITFSNYDIRENNNIGLFKEEVWDRLNHCDIRTSFIPISGRLVFLVNAKSKKTIDDFFDDFIPFIEDGFMERGHVVNKTVYR